MHYDDRDPYGYYPDPVDDRAVSYDELMTKVEDGEFTAVVNIPDRDAIYWMSCGIEPHSDLLNSEDDDLREFTFVRCLVALGVRVEAALKQE